MVYLTLSAQYESFALPFIILLAVPMAVLGALLFIWLRGLVNDVYVQIGLVMLIGLSAKNSILIVEFAEQLIERGRSIIDAAIEAAELRLRPILMTSFAFILGVLPLYFATGAGQAGPALGRNRDRRRHVVLHRAQPVLHSGAVRDSEDAAGFALKPESDARRKNSGAGVVGSGSSPVSLLLTSGPSRWSSAPVT